MPKVAILSRDARSYQTLVNNAQLPDLELLFVEDKTVDFDYSQIDILFGDPDLTSLIVKQCSNLKWLQSTWAGNANLLALEKNDYQLCGVKDVYQHLMQEYVFAYILNFSRNISGFSQAQQNKSWHKPQYQPLAGKTIGIMGVGNIGKAIAKMAKNFSMKTRGYSNTSNDCDAVDQYFRPNQEEAFATGLDFLVCLLPQTQATTKLIDSDFLCYLPPQNILINVGRGSTIDDDALIEALKNKTIQAAVLDVFNQEPLPETHPFWEMDNVFVTQHTAAESFPTDIFPIFKDNYLRYFKGESLLYVLDFAKGY